MKCSASRFARGRARRSRVVAFSGIAAATSDDQGDRRYANAVESKQRGVRGRDDDGDGWDGGGTAKVSSLLNYLPLSPCRHEGGGTVGVGPWGATLAEIFLFN